MNRLLAVVLLWAVPALSASSYYIGKQGQSCSQVCFEQGKNCNPRIVTNNSADIFKQLGVTCKPNPKAWWAEDQPSFVSGSTDPNHGDCVGYTNVPGGVLCAGSFPTTSRLCRCDEPSTQRLTFGTGLSAGHITQQEQWVFQHFVAPGDVGVMTHFWATYSTSVDPGVVIRYYVDGESVPSIEFQPSMACGVGFFDAHAPWGTKWFGKGAKDGSWFLNFRIPFSKSIVVTAQHMYGSYGGFYMIVRGGVNLPIDIGGVTLPPTARLQLHKVSGAFQPLEWVTAVNVTAKTEGLMFMHTLAVQSGDLNFLEGCYHMYTGDQEFPGTILSTGTEDYFDSGWYFSAGQFQFPVSGFTHLQKNGTSLTWSAYRFHEMDPLRFTGNFRFVWRNGDIDDPAGMKCMMEKPGTVVGNPTVSNVSSYAWV